MKGGSQTRREFLTSSSRAATAGWLALQLPWVAALASCAGDDAAADGGFTHLSAAEARTLRAFASQIIPSDDDIPGADEAGAVHFIDRALGTPFFEANAPTIRAGLADLDARAKAMGARRGFASLTSAQQVTILQRVEREPFFAAARSLVVIGTLAEPSYGGNRDGAGWRMLGIDHAPSYHAPFGWYDEQRTRVPSAT